MASIVNLKITVNDYTRIKSVLYMKSHLETGHLL